MTPYYITGATCLIAFAAFFIGRHSMYLELEEYFDDLFHEHQAKEKEAKGLHSPDLK